MDFVSNLVWAVLSLSLICATYFGVRAGKVRLPMRSALVLAGLLCFILLPVISRVDDQLEATQAALPLSGQTWLLAAQGSSAEAGKLLAAALILAALLCVLTVGQGVSTEQWNARPLARRLARSQRLRPPLTSAR